MTANKFCHDLSEVFFRNWKIICEKYAIVFGLLASAVTIVSTFVPCIGQLGIYALFVLLILSLFIAICMAWPTNSIEIKLSKTASLKVFEGDIFSIKKGVVVIPFNDYFDTLVDNKVVGTNTLHGMFVNKFRKEYPTVNLDEEIRKSLSAYEYTENKERPIEGKHNKYPLAAVARVSVNAELHFYLLAATEFNWENHPIDQPEMYGYILQKLYKYINTNCSGLPVYMPIIGTGQMGLDMTKENALYEMIHNMMLVKPYVTRGGSNIVIYKGDMPDISLNRIKYLLRL